MDKIPATFQQYKDTLEQLFFKFVEASIKFVRRNLKEIVPSTDGNLAFSLLRMMDCFFAPFVPEEVSAICHHSIPFIVVTPK